MVVFFLHELCSKQLKSDGRLRKVLTGIGFVTITTVFVIGVVVTQRVAMSVWLGGELLLLSFWSLSNLYFGLIKARSLIYVAPSAATNKMTTGANPAPPSAHPPKPHVGSLTDEQKQHATIVVTVTAAPASTTTTTTTTTTTLAPPTAGTGGSPKPSTDVAGSTPDALELRTLVPPSPGAAGGRPSALSSPTAASSPSPSPSNALDRSVRNIIRGCIVCGVMGLAAVILIWGLSFQMAYQTQLLLFVLMRVVSVLWNFSMVWIFFPVIRPVSLLHHHHNNNYNKSTLAAPIKSQLYSSAPVSSHR